MYTVDALQIQDEATGEWAWLLWVWFVRGMTETQLPMQFVLSLIYSHVVLILQVSHCERFGYGYMVSQVGVVVGVA